MRGFGIATLACTSLMLAALTGSCASNQPATSTTSTPVSQAPVVKIPGPAISDEKPKDYAGLHNVVAYHEHYWSGSVPEGDEGFETLRAMGVKTIISVDGAEPDLARAKAHGMRYIHLPIGYNGFDEERKLQLVRATRDSMEDGPTYIHCHHGKHRSAGAAGTVVASLGWATPEDMVKRMKVSGTAAGYKGLYACTSSATVLAANVVDAVPAEMPEVSRPTGFVKGMVEIDEINEHLKAIEKAGWVTPKDHPDLVPAAEAGRMVDLLRVLTDTGKTRSHPVEFAAMMRENEARAQKLEDMLIAKDLDPKALSEQFKLVAASCKDCHVKFRD